MAWVINSQFSELAVLNDVMESFNPFSGWSKGERAFMGGPGPGEIFLYYATMSYETKSLAVYLPIEN